MPTGDLQNCWMPFPYNPYWQQDPRGYPRWYPNYAPPVCPCCGRPYHYEYTITWEIGKDAVTGENQTVKQGQP